MLQQADYGVYYQKHSRLKPFNSRGVFMSRTVRWHLETINLWPPVALETHCSTTKMKPLRVS